jgi:hypothetical protein
MARSSEARKVLRELDKELSLASKRVGQNVVWSAAPPGRVRFAYVKALASTAGA